MLDSKFSRRDSFRLMAGSGGRAAAVLRPAFGKGASTTPAHVQNSTFDPPEDRTRRMKWWHEAKFGMCIH